MTQKNEEHSRNDNICWFCEKLIKSNKVRDHCFLTDEYRASAHEKCNKSVKQKQSNFIPLACHIFGKYDCHLFFEKIIDKRMTILN